MTAQTGVLVLQTWYKHEPSERASDTSVHKFKFVADFECCAHEVMALAREFDLISTWTNLMLDSKILSYLGFLDFSVYSGIRFPWPFAARQAFVRARGSHCLQSDGSLLVLVESFEPSKARFAAPTMWLPKQ